MGRWLETEQGVKLAIARALAPGIDRLYFWHPDHCRDIFRQEQTAYESLYP